MKKRRPPQEKIRAFMASPEGRAWLERKKAEKRDVDVAPERLTRTKLPFEATINDERVLVYRQEGEIVIEYLPEKEPTMWEEFDD